MSPFKILLFYLSLWGCGHCVHFVYFCRRFIMDLFSLFSRIQRLLEKLITSCYKNSQEERLTWQQRAQQIYRTAKIVWSGMIWLREPESFCERLIQTFICLFFNADHILLILWGFWIYDLWSNRFKSVLSNENEIGELERERDRQRHRETEGCRNNLKGIERQRKLKMRREGGFRKDYGGTNGRS